SFTAGEAHEACRIRGACRSRKCLSECAGSARTRCAAVPGAAGSNTHLGYASTAHGSHSATRQYQLVTQWYLSEPQSSFVILSPLLAKDRRGCLGCQSSYWLFGQEILAKKPGKAEADMRTRAGAS